MRWLFDYLVNFYFFCMLQNLVSAFNFFLLIAILIFLSVKTNNQTKCSIIYEKNAMWADDDEQMINYEWPKQQHC